ncbi:CDP-glycerol glycerophosphotransferase family protein [Thiomicrospira microaerophila]|uniref:CDP-glycerol glycerophosphotransferase family protein n=1 Tax=Thiomicrospira microaerophila TaxID=406020 RepID=UPI0005C99D46|nr:CDP-glycerol glycerophosphotransferase family protein [Thiomicrospira microaerophila]
MKQPLWNPFFLAGAYFYRKHNYASCIKSLNTALKLTNNNQSILFKLGMAHTKLGNWLDASKIFEQALALPNPHPKTKKQLEASKKNIKSALKPNGMTSSIERFGEGAYHQSKGDWKQAQQAYAEQLNKTPWDAELCYRLGMAHDRCYEWSQAQEYYELALALDITQTYWHYRLGFVLERQNKFEQAAIAYEYAAKNRDKHTPYWFYRWGYVLEQAGKHDQACLAYLQTRNQPELDKPEPILDVEYNQEPSEAHNALNATQADQAELALAEAKISQPETIDPLEEYKQHLTNQSVIAQHLERILQQDTTNPQTWYKLGNTYERMQNWPKAAEAYQYALDRQNDHTPEWYYRLGYVLTQLKSYQLACISLRQLEVLQEYYGVVNKSFKTEGVLLDTHYINSLNSTPIENIALFESFGGVGLSCNPYAIFKKMIKDKFFKDWLFVVIVESTLNLPKNLLSNRKIIPVKKNTYLYRLYLAKSKVLINNGTFPVYFTKRQEQLLISTWHGTPWKTLGNDNPMQNGNTARNFIHSDYLISPNAHTSKTLIERYGIKSLFSGELLEIGYPRIDLMINATEGLKERIRKRLRLNPTKPVVLYAPTYRGFWESPQIETDNLIHSIKKIQSNNYQLVFRGHYFTEEQIKKLDMEITIADHSIDTCELLSIVDILVTDYSSILFDFLVKQKPIFLLTQDIDVYKEQRGLYLALEEVPGFNVKDTDALKPHLEKAIKYPEQYTGNLESFIRIFSSNEDGQATQRLLLKIKYWIENGVQSEKELKTKDQILIYPGTIETLEDVNRLQQVIEKKLSPDAQATLIFDNTQLVKNQEIRKNVESIRGVLSFIEYSGKMVNTPDEKWLVYKHLNENFNPSAQAEKMLSEIYKKEYQRIFGSHTFKDYIAIQEEGMFWSNMFKNKQDK